MNVIFRIIRRVILNNPVNLREVQASLGNICAEQNTCLCLTEFKIG
jgi:hypothetical protein